jgi:secreted trypsin-like serine protease
MRAAVSTIVVASGLACFGLLQQDPGTTTEPSSAGRDLGGTSQLDEPGAVGQQPQLKAGSSTPPQAKGTRAAAAGGRSVKDDPRYKKNDLWDRSRPQRLFRIYNGDRTGGYPDCVAVEGWDPDAEKTHYIGTGTLVGKNVVLTAGHLMTKKEDRNGGITRIFFGDDITKPSEGRTVAVKKAIRHEKYCERDGYPVVDNDIAILVLGEDVVVVPPRAFAPSSVIDTAKVVRAVGFGVSNEQPGVMSLKRRADIAVATCDCNGTFDGKPDGDSYGCHAVYEMVTRDPVRRKVPDHPELAKDTCQGDSGGPGLIQCGDEWCLAGVISRGTKGNIVLNLYCGDGSIFVRIDKFKGWIQEAAKKNGGSMP